MPAGGRGASVSACADLTNQLQCCWVDPACGWKNTDRAIVGYRWAGSPHAWKKHWHINCRLPVGGVTTPCTVNWCKKVRGAWLASSYCMGFQNFVVSNKIHPSPSSFWAKGCILMIVCLCVIWHDMTTPPWWREKVLVYYLFFFTLSGRIGKVVASHAAVARSVPALRFHWFILCTRLSEGTAHEGGGCDQSIGSTVSDAIVRSWLWLTETRSSPLACFSTLLQIVDNWTHILW